MATNVTRINDVGGKMNNNIVTQDDLEEMLFGTPKDDNGDYAVLDEVLAKFDAINQSEGETDYYINKFEVREILSKYFT
jgi:hypothetical protein